MKIIPLTQGKNAVVDGEDFEYLSKHRWYYSSNGPSRTVGKMERVKFGLTFGRTIPMKRVIAWRMAKGLQRKQLINRVTIYKNGNELDNTRANIGVVTQVEAMANGPVKVWRCRRGKWKGKVLTFKCT